jgi:tetratricopeptide (TPR) repeat protein
MRWVLVVALCLAATPTTTRADDWGAKRNPFDPGVVRRYKALLEKDPHDEAALRALVGMYKRYRTVAQLESEYRAILERGDDWAALVVLARMPRTSLTDTVALWKRVLAVKPDDARGWLASGDAATAVADAAGARDAYRKAAALLTAPKQKRDVLAKLVGAARTVGDHAVVDAAFVELIALAPKDGALWLERGNAQLAAGKAQAAHTSLVTAEGLLKTDPEKRLTAMLDQGLALERLGKVDDALAQYEHTLDKSPRGYFLAAEVVTRIVDAERKRGRIRDATARLAKRWPEKQRGYYEWDMLGDLYKESGYEGVAIDAYKRAVAKAPTEVVTQRKLIALLDRLRPAEALAQHELAARVAPGDADLQLELAKRYYPAQLPKALATLERLAKRHPQNINVRRTIGTLYDQWGELPRAIGEYEVLATLEPKDIDHLLTLGDAYFRADNMAKALASWDRLDVLGTADAHFRHGEILANHELWEDASKAYTLALGRDGTHANAYYGRARSYDAMGKLAEAVEDSRRAVALLGMASHVDGMRNRHQLVRILGHAQADGDKQALRRMLTRWRFAFDHGDAAAGYVLAAHHSRIASEQLHDVLAALYRRVPTDDSLGIALARSYVHKKDFGAARNELERIAKRSPKKAEEISKLIAQVEEDRVRYELESRWAEEGASPSSRQRNVRPDIVGRRRRLGMRLALGADVRNTSSAQLGIGIYRFHRVADGTAIEARLEWSQRDDQLEEVNAVALGGILTRRLVDARTFEVALGVGPRVEVRYGSDVMMSSWDRAAIGADATLELVPRALPATLGVRFHQSLTDATHGSSVLFELGFEVR